MHYAESGERCALRKCGRLLHAHLTIPKLHHGTVHGKGAVYCCSERTRAKSEGFKRKRIPFCTYLGVASLVVVKLTISRESAAVGSGKWRPSARSVPFLVGRPAKWVSPASGY